MAPLPTPVSNYASTVIDNRIYVLGGITSEQTVFNAPFAVSYVAITSTNFVQIYDPETNQWTYGTPLPEAMHGMGATSSTGLIYVFGGIAGENTSSKNPVPVDWTQIYNPQAGNWFRGAPLPAANYAASCANVNGELYVLSGIDGNQNWLTTNYEYTPAGYIAENSPYPSISQTSSPTEQPTLTPTTSPSEYPSLSPSIPELPFLVVLSVFAATTATAVAIARKKKSSAW